MTIRAHTCYPWWFLTDTFTASVHAEVQANLVELKSKLESPNTTFRARQL